MNKLFNKIAVGIVSIAMAVGVGVFAGSEKKESVPVQATSSTWELVTSAPSDWSGQYILCNGTSGTVKMMKVSAYTGGDNMTGTNVTVTNGTITADDSNAITISASVAGTSGKYTIVANGYWIGKNANSNGIDARATSGTYSTSYNNAISYGSKKVTIAGNGGRTLTWFASNSNFKYYSSSNNNAQLYRKVASYTITFDANGGSGTLPGNITGSGSKTLPSSASLTKTGYTLDGWGDSSHKDDANAQYALGASYTLNGDIKLYAHWSANKYSVSASITNGGFIGATGANAATYGTAYNATITANTNYNLPADLTVTMGGTATNAYTYNSSTGAFSIASPTGSISISGVCTPNATKYVITTTATNGSYSGDTSIYSGFTASITFTANNHYKLPSSSDAFTVEHAEIQSYNASTGVLVLENADDDVTVSVSMDAKAQNTISMGTLTGVSQADGNPTSVEEGATVTLTFTANEGYGLPTSSGVTVTGTGSSSTWTQGTGKLQITGGTGNITVSIVGIVRTLTSITLSSSSGTYTLGDTFEMPTVTAVYNVGGNEDVTLKASASGGGLENGILTSAGTKTITISYGGRTATYTATVNAVVPAAAHISKVTSTSDLTVGSTVYLVCEGRTQELDSISTTSTKYGIGTSYTTTPAGAYALTVCAGYGGNNYAFKNSSNNYLYWNSGNSLDVNSTLSNATSWTVSFDDDGNATILNVADSGRQIMWNYSSPRFACYSDKTPTYDDTQGYNMVQIYKNYPAVVKSLKWITAEVKSGTYYKGTSVTASNFTVTGHYDDGSTDTPTTGITVTNGELTVVGTNNVTLTYGGKSCVVPVTASQAPVSTVTLDPTSASIGLDEPYWLSDIHVTVSPSYAIQSYSWQLYNAGGLVEGKDYTFDGDEYHSINPGTVVFRCTSTTDESKYADFTLTIIGTPEAEFAKDSTFGYVGKTETISFTYMNFDASDIAIASGNTSYVTIGTISASEGSGTVVINFVGAGTTSVTISDGNSTLDTLSVTAEADSVIQVTWSAGNIDVWSGATLSTTGWNVQYKMASGDTGSAPSYTIKLGSATVTAGYTFTGADNGKTMHVEYGGVSSSSITVTVTQRINNVYTPESSDSYDYTFTAQAWSAAGNQTLGGHVWTMAGTGTGYWGYDSQNGKGQQFGSGSNPFSAVSLTCSDFSGTIDSVTVYTSGASSINATVQVSVGNTAYGEVESITASNSAYTFDLGGESGDVVISWVNSSSKAIYIKEIVVETTTPSANIANSESHKEAQRKVVEFANYMNTTMNGENVCTGSFANLQTAWNSVATKYNQLFGTGTTLSETELAWAKDLLANATAQWGSDADEACVEKAMMTYEFCVSHYKGTCNAFMSAVRPVSAGRITSYANILGGNSNAAAIVIIVSALSVAAIGGYFFLRKKKEQ